VCSIDLKLLHCDTRAGQSRRAGACAPTDPSKSLNLLGAQLWLPAWCRRQLSQHCLHLIGCMHATCPAQLPARLRARSDKQHSTNPAAIELKRTGAMHITGNKLRLHNDYEVTCMPVAMWVLWKDASLAAGCLPDSFQQRALSKDAHWHTLPTHLKSLPHLQGF
jgi:hypothetical protein